MQTARGESSIYIFGETLLKRESAAEHTVCRESAEAIVPPKQTTPVGRAESGVGNHLHLRTYSNRAKKNTEMYEGATERRNEEQHSRKNTLYYIVICYGLTMY